MAWIDVQTARMRRSWNAGEKTFFLNALLIELFCHALNANNGFPSVRAGVDKTFGSAVEYLTSKGL